MNSPQWRRGSSHINDSKSSAPPKGICSFCGQTHLTAEPHIYDYIQEVDEDLLCQICLQPLVAPTDTKCGHTFCYACLNNYLKIQPLCPLDRTVLTSADCQPASLMVKRLVDKLLVKCPISSHCAAAIPRSELEDHLRFRCSGQSYSNKDNSLSNNNEENRESHNLNSSLSCISLPKPEGDPQAFIVEGELSKIEIQRTSSALGIRIVGGCDSPLRCIVVQEIFPDSLIAQDGRLKPGDQLIEVNGDDLTCCTHMQACSALLQATPVLLLTVYRDRADSYSQVFNEETHWITLIKHSKQPIGCKFTTKRYEPGIYVAEVTEGSIAAQEGSLLLDDKILEINGHDTRFARVEEAYLLLQASSRRVDLLISRRSGGGATFPTISHSRSNSYPGTVAEASNISENENGSPVIKTRRSNRPPPERPMQPKYFTITKAPNESLGISVSGGLHGYHSDTPIYITNIQSQGCLGRSGQIKKGDILLSVNGKSLLGMKHAEAIKELKMAATASSVILGIFEGPETSVSASNFVPSWMYWQNLPRILHMPKTIVLHRSSTGSLGFSIVGGKDSVNGDQPIHILLVVHDSPAAREGKLKCGDQILAVNGYRLDGVRHTTAVAMLKNTKNRVVLEVLSWPGTQL
uniref:E3 ubiquitin-protein ligase LNX n=1 Tax=Scolopendra viridis TaxID=118503 RepID=A0A4D5R9T9_SCOVI